jgi:hypothetical protein
MDSIVANYHLNMDSIVANCHRDFICKSLVAIFHGYFAVALWEAKTLCGSIGTPLRERAQAHAGAGDDLDRAGGRCIAAVRLGRRRLPMAPGR